MNTKYKILLERYRKLESIVRNKDGRPQTLGARTKDLPVFREIITLRSVQDIEYHCNSAVLNESVKENMIDYMTTKHRQFSYYKDSGEIIASIDMGGNLHTNIK